MSSTPNKPEETKQSPAKSYTPSSLILREKKVEAPTTSSVQPQPSKGEDNLSRPGSVPAFQSTNKPIGPPKDKSVEFQLIEARKAAIVEKIKSRSVEPPKGQAPSTVLPNIPPIEVSKAQSMEKLKTLPDESQKMKPVEIEKVQSIDAKQVKSIDVKQFQPAEPKKVQSAEHEKMQATESQKVQPTVHQKVQPTQSIEPQKMQSTDSQQVQPAEIKKEQPLEPPKIQAIESSKPQSIEKPSIESSKEQFVEPPKLQPTISPKERSTEQFKVQPMEVSNSQSTEQQKEPSANSAAAPMQIETTLHNGVPKATVVPAPSTPQKEPPNKSFLAQTVFQPPSTTDQVLACYKEYCKLYYANIILTNQLKSLLDEKNELMQKVSKYETAKRPEELRQPSWAPSALSYEGKKRHRRTAGEIDRHYRCPFPGCLKSYGSEGSLSQHIKLKHRFGVPSGSNMGAGASVGRQSMGSEHIHDPQGQSSYRSEGDNTESYKQMAQ